MDGMDGWDGWIELGFLLHQPGLFVIWRGFLLYDDNDNDRQWK